VNTLTDKSGVTDNAAFKVNIETTKTFRPDSETTKTFRPDSETTKTFKSDSETTKTFNQIRQCEYCGKPFSFARKDRRFCSTKCKSANWNKLNVS
jgi:predicted nucleic acid binding AN1-type Zn finger protein